MATRRSKLPSPGTGGGIITKTLMKLGSGLKNTPGALYRAITGGPREQTYGNIADLWPAKKRYKRRTNRISYIDRQTSTATAIPPMPGMDTEEILDLMKRNFEQEKRYREVQRSFDEEKAGEEQQRHEELIKALKDFTGTGTATPIAEKKKESGLLDSIMDMLSSLKDKLQGMIEKIAESQIFKDATSWLKDLIKSPAFAAAGIATILAAALGGSLIALWGLELDKLKQIAGAKGAEAGAQRQTAEVLGAMDPSALGTAIMDQVEGKETSTDVIAKETKKIQETRAALYEPHGFKPKTVDKNGVWQFENDKGQIPPQELGKQIDSQAVGLVNSGNEIEYKGAQRPLMQGITPSNAGGGRGTQLYDYKLRELEMSGEASKAAFGVRPKGIAPKVTEVPPPPSSVSRVIAENMDLAVNTNPMGDTTGGLIVQQNEMASTKNEGPLPVTATQRDDEPMAAIVFRTQRRKAKAY